MPVDGIKADLQAIDRQSQELLAALRAFAEATPDCQRLFYTVAERMARLAQSGAVVALLTEGEQNITIAAWHFEDPELRARATGWGALGSKSLGDSSLAARVVQARREIVLHDVFFDLLASDRATA